MHTREQLNKGREAFLIRSHGTVQVSHSACSFYKTRITIYKSRKEYCSPMSHCHTDDGLQYFFLRYLCLTQNICRVLVHIQSVKQVRVSIGKENETSYIKKL